MFEFDIVMKNLLVSTLHVLVESFQCDSHLDGYLSNHKVVRMCILEQSFWNIMPLLDCTNKTKYMKMIKGDNISTIYACFDLSFQGLNTTTKCFHWVSKTSICPPQGTWCILTHLCLRASKSTFLGDECTIQFLQSNEQEQEDVNVMQQLHLLTIHTYPLGGFNSVSKNMLSHTFQ